MGDGADQFFDAGFEAWLNEDSPTVEEEEEEVHCWDCSNPLTSPIDKEREECARCFAILDGPYDEDNQEEND